MSKLFGMIVCTLLCSFYIFPFTFTFFPYANTKMMMAGLGIFILVYRLSKNNDAQIYRELMILSAIAVMVSLAGYVSMVFNDSSDYTYGSYLISMWVWLGGVYTLLIAILSVHKHLGVKLMVNYYVAVGILQCLLALSMSFYPGIKGFIDSILDGIGFMGKAPGRMYGLGCALDVAGEKFAAFLIMIGFMIIASLRGYIQSSRLTLYYYTFGFILISTVGDMISRSTAIGTAFAIVLAIYYSHKNPQKFSLDFNKGYFIANTLLFAVVLLMIIVHMYNTDPTFHKEIRFAFEGFFSLYEKGQWEVHSNDMLKNMVIFPDNLKTWIIGDGYFKSPHLSDPYYLGTEKTEFYKGTDIGYLRFIFYFGLLGLSIFIWYFYMVAKSCWSKFPTYKTMFVSILLLNLVMWFKVSSDIFSIFAPFLIITKKENLSYMRDINEITEDTGQ